MCNTLSRASVSNSSVIVTLKQKLHYRGYAYFESVGPDFIFMLLQFLKVSNHLYHDTEKNKSNIPANLVCKSSTKVFFNNINLLDNTKIDDLSPLIIKGSSVHDNSKALRNQKMVKLSILFNMTHPLPIVSEDENILNMEGFGSPKLSGVDHNFNSSDYSVSDSKASVDLRTNHSCPMEVDANVSNHTSCAFNHESNSEQDKNPLDIFK